MSRPKFRYFAIFGTMRTGSNLLERQINQYDGLICHGEMFNPGFIGASGVDRFEGLHLSDRERDPMALIERMIATSDGKLPGFRIFQGHDQRVEAAALAADDCAKIILRRDPLDSFVSLGIARKTDQWILGNATTKRSATITFNAGEYESYLTELEAYYARIRRALQSAGQTAFELRYEDLKSPEVMNGLSAFLGHPEERRDFKEPIKRQNPEPMSEKVENYPEMMAALGNIGAGATAPARAVPTIGARELILCDTPPILFAPVPGTARNPVMSWLKDFGGSLLRDLNQKELGNWLDQSGGAVSISLVEHPLTRAYRVFQKRIFAKDGNRYGVIVDRLTAHYGLNIPDEDPTLDETQAAFETFLEFLKVNLAGQTSLRIDPEWDLQTRFLEGMSATHPIAHVIRDRDFPRRSQQIAALFGRDVGRGGMASHGGGHPLAKFYTPRLEKLCRDAYRLDYRHLGFGAWKDD